MKLTFVALVLLLAGCGTQPHVPINGAQPHAPSGALVQPCTQCSGTVFVGDSIFGRLVADTTFTNAGYINAGVFGERTDEMLARFPEIISGQNVCHGDNPPAGSPADPNFPYVCSPLPEQPRTVVIMGGWNNFFQNNPGNTAFSDIQSMAFLAEERGIKVIVCTLYAYDPGHPAPWMVPTGNAPVTFYNVWRNPLNVEIRFLDNTSVDELRSIGNISVVDLSSVFAGQSFYTIDGVHPTDAGNTQMMNAIIPSI
jgi:hypothetical protein